MTPLRDRLACRLKVWNTVEVFMKYFWIMQYSFMNLIHEFWLELNSPVLKHQFFSYFYPCGTQDDVWRDFGF